LPVVVVVAVVVVQWPLCLVVAGHVVPRSTVTY